MTRHDTTQQDTTQHSPKATPLPILLLLVLLLLALHLVEFHLVSDVFLLDAADPAPNLQAAGVVLEGQSEVEAGSNWENSGAGGDDWCCGRGRG